MNRPPYRLAIRAYPTYYRRDHGEEMIQTALDLNDGKPTVTEAAAFVRGGLAMSVRDVRRLWVLAAIPAILYGPLFVFNTVTHDRDVVEHSHFLINLTWVLKLLTVVGVPVLLKLVVARTAEQADRWKRSFLVWVSVGVAVVYGLSFVRAEFATLSNSLSFFATYPGGPEAPEGIAAAPSLAALLVRELIAVVFIAAAAAWLSKFPKRALFAIPTSCFSILCVYLLATPWSFKLDYDMFVGDTMLGGTFGELLFPFAPFDGFGALALSISALVITVQILAWGGATASAPIRRTAPKAHDSAGLAANRTRS